MYRRITSYILSFFGILLAVLLVAVGSVHGQAALSDYRLEPAGPHVEALGYGLASELDLTLTNEADNQADWKLVFENSGPTDPAGTLESLDEAAAELLPIIADRYLFSEGVTGSSISDGGGDMYDGGNFLEVAGTKLAYSNGVVTNTTVGAGRVSYFTRKYDGLFVFGADFTGVDDFAITGNLGADGSGQVSVDEFTIQKGGIPYRAFVHRVHGAGDPSINQLILVPSKAGLNRSHLTTTDNENHRISGLGASSRIFYLLFAKPSGGLYPTRTFEDLANAFLDSVGGGPGWAFGNPASGSIASGQSGPVKLTLDSAELPPGTYTTRFAVVPQAMDYADIPAVTFRDLTLNVGEPAFTIPSGNLTIASLSGLSPDAMDVTLAPAIEGSVLTDLQTSSSESWLVPSVGTGPNTIRLTFNTTMLAPGTHRATVVVWNGETRQTFEVSVVAAPLNIVRFLPDPSRPRLYAINANGKDHGVILVIDTLTHAIIRMIPVGQEPTDIDLTENAAELLVMNTTDRSISRIDLDTLALTATHQLTDFSNRNEDFGGHVVDGPGNVLYYVDEQWGPRLRVYDTSTGTVLQTFGATSIGDNNDNGFGDIVVNPDKTALFGWVQYGDGAGWAGSFVVRYHIAADGTLALAGQGNSTYPTPLSREPFDSAALMSADGSRLIIKDRVIDQGNPGVFPIIYPDEIYSMSPNGEIVASSSSIHPGRGGEILHTLPVASTVQAILPDYSAMVSFNAVSREIVWLDLISTLGAGALGLQISPEDGATVAQPERFQWFPVTGISRYQIHLGTVRSVVETATSTSSTYLGETGNTWIDLASPLAAGQTYFWRVVPIGSDGQPAGTGVTRSFFVSNLTLSRSSIDAETVEGVARHVETIGLQAAGPQQWSVTADVPWIGFENTSGATPGDLVAYFDATSLTSGYHDAHITMTSGGVSFAIPVRLRVHAANFMITEADLELPWVYAISQESNTSGQPSFLLRINTATDVIETAVPCGRSVTDLSIHYQENRIYLTNWQTGILRAFDRDSFAQVRTYQFGPAGAVGSSEGDIWEVSAGRNGRLIVEEYDQWIGMSLIDTADGRSISTGSAREGGGLFDPTGRYYYHGENNSSGAALRKYDTVAETFVEMKSARVDSFSYYGSRKVVMSGDGERIFWNGGVFDRNLEVLLRFSQQIIGSTFHSDLLFSSTMAYNGSTGLELAALPATANVLSVTGDQTKLYLFPSNTKSFRVVDLSTIATLPPREVTPTIADGSTVIGAHQSLAWSIEPFATSYRIFFGTSRDAVLNATEASPEHLGNSVTPAWTGAMPTLSFGGDYFWRVDTVGFSGSRKGEVWSFSIAPLLIDPVKLELVLPVGSPVETRSLSVTGPAGVAWTASTSTPWLSVVTPQGTTPGTVGLRVNVAGLAAGTRQGAVSFQSGTDTWELPVALEIVALNYIVAEADREAPYIYAVSQAPNGTDDRAFMVVIDTRSQTISRVVPVGRSVTDLAVHYQENRIYVSNWQTGKLLAFDRDTLEEIRAYSYGAAGGYGTSSGDVYQVAAGRAGRVVIEQEDQWIDFFLIDTATGNKLATGHAREGGGVFDPTGRYYYHGENNSSGAELQKYDTASNTFIELTSNRVSSFSYYGSRRVLTSGDGSRVFWNGGVFDSDLNVRLLLTDEVVASTYRGELLFTDDSAFNGLNGEKLATLPVTTTLQTVSSDQRKLFLFKAGAFSVVDIGTIAEVSPRGLIPGIADASTVIGRTQELSWSLEAAALSHDIYFGTSEAAVSSATRTSPEFLGNTTGTTWTGALPALALAQTYWWRVDIVGFNTTTTGTPWSFKIAPILVAPQSLDLAFPGNTPIPRQTLALTQPFGTAWTASTSTPWIRLASNSGRTPLNFGFDIDSTGLAVGSHEGAITFQAAGETFSVPVSLRVLALNITKLVPHPSLPVVYGINTSAAGEGFSHLLEIDAASANILRSLPIGFNPTDADFDPVTSRLYVSNWGFSQTRVIDVAAWAELPPLNLGVDVYKLEITPNGRLLTEEEDQWIDLSMWNAATGTKLSSAGFSVREGDGEADPTGNFYYHCDNNISNAHITKYDISGGNFVTVAAGQEIGYGSRNLILSADGSRLFWQARVMDSDLRMIGQMPAEIHAANRDGALAIGAGTVWWSDSGTVAATLPFASTIAAVSADDSHLLRFNASTRTLHSTPLSSIADLPGPWPRPSQVLGESPDRLSWSPVAGATSYRVFIAPDAAALAAMSAPVANVMSPWYDIPSPMDFGSFYSWRVDAVTAGGVVSGTVRSFGISFPQGPPLAVSGSSGTGISASISDRHLLVGMQTGIQNSAQIYQFDPMSGASSPEQSFTLPGYYFDHQFGTAVAMDAGKAGVGAYSYDNPADGSGAAFIYRQGASGYWESSGPLAPAAPVAGDSFGRSLAASGNLMLVGGGGAYGQPGRVTAYVTEPSAVRVQTFTAADSGADDKFGRTIAMDGNQAIISAAGRSTSYNPLYAFSRSATTGLWGQTQKIALPGTTSSSYTSPPVALSRRYLATRAEFTRGSTGPVIVIYTKDGNGQWIHSASINQSSIAGSSSYSFGNALALSDDRLFIGDTGATYGGKSGGAVFSFRLSGTEWVAGPVIVPDAVSYTGFGSALALRDGWLIATGGSSQPAWLFRVDAAANHTPAFRANIPTQMVAGRSFSMEILADDADGNAGLEIDLLQGPAWLSLTDETNGRALLQGTPQGISGAVHTIQLRVRDDQGAQAHHTYQLTLLAATDLPRFTLEPTGRDAGEGQEVILRAAVEGIGPFQWQWFRGDAPIPGATSSRFALAEASLADSGEYSVRVSNVVGEIRSAVITLDVRPANRFAGDWPTFGGSARHTGYHPAKLGRHTFVTAWSRQIHSTNALNRVAVADGRVFVSASSRFETAPTIHALGLANGGNLWTASIPSSNSINPPTWHDGTVYFQRGKGVYEEVGPQLIALDAATGARRWASVFGAQWESYEAPAVTDDGIWINGGTYGGLYGFDLLGNQRFFRSLAQEDGWTPTISGDRLFSWVGGLFQEHNPWDGTTLWSITVSTDSYGSTGVSAISADSAVIAGYSEIVCIDLPSRSIRWRRAGNFTGTPAISNGRTYAIQGANVLSYSLTDGNPGPTVTVPATIVSGQPLLVMEHLFFASATNTYMVDLASSAIVRTFSGGGRLSYSQGYLLAAGNDGMLRAWYANGAPEFTASLPVTINAGDAAPDFQINLTDHVEDIDPGETLSWEITSLSNPSIFRTFEIGSGSGVLAVVYNPWTQGTSTAAIAVTDGVGNRTETTLEFTLPDLPDPLVTVDPVIRFSRLTGLYEQKVTVTNIAQREIAGFDLSITGLRAGVMLYNGSATGAGSGRIAHHLPMAAGTSVALVLEYYASPRGDIPLPEIVATVTLPDAMSRLATTTARAAPAFAVNRCVKQPDGSLVIEFTTEPGKRYRIQYSEDATHWKSCPVSIKAGGTKVQWIDRGPPWTDAMPSSIPSRFYRVVRLDD